MSDATIIEALAIPVDARVDQRVPKKLLLEQGAPTAADKRLIQDGIDELFWVAALKPSTIGIPAYRDEIREYLEVAVLSSTFRPRAKGPRLTELIHRAIPYPLFLVASQAGTTSISLAPKRFSQAENAQVVLESHVTAVALSPAPSKEEASFLASLPIAAQPARDLFAMYQGWIDLVAALEAARLTGSFVLLDSPDRAARRRVALDECVRLEREMTVLRSRAESETQMRRLAGPASSDGADGGREVSKLRTNEASEPRRTPDEECRHPGGERGRPQVTLAGSVYRGGDRL